MGTYKIMPYMYQVHTKEVVFLGTYQAHTYVCMLRKKLKHIFLYPLCEQKNRLNPKRDEDLVLIHTNFHLLLKE